MTEIHLVRLSSLLMGSHDNDRFHQVVYVHYGHPPNLVSLPNGSINHAAFALHPICTFPLESALESVGL